jgi:hypothetical protein
VGGVDATNVVSQHVFIAANILCVLYALIVFCLNRINGGI